MSASESLHDVVAHGLCIGCGLCEAMAGPDRIQMTMTAEGRLRPALSPLPKAEEDRILAVCPGTRVSAEAEQGVETDPVWGGYRALRMAWAGDPEIRHKAATGGVLTGLAAFLVETGRAAFILHVGPDPRAPMRSTWRLSEDRSEILAGTASRYGPTSTLAGLEVALRREEPFVLIGKPCDIGAVRRLAKLDPRIDERCVAMLTLICGGASELTKSQDVLDEEGVSEDQLSLFRYRGHGNPGPTRVETTDGRSFERSYAEMWGDESGWKLQTRCKICPDAIGEAADIVSGDAWPGGGPTGEDAGFNVVIARTARGAKLLDEAARRGALVLGETVGPRDLDDFQPHQVRKKKAVAARYAALRALGRPDLETQGLRISELAGSRSLAELLREARGTLRRAKQGRMDEEQVPDQ